MPNSIEIRPVDPLSASILARILELEQACFSDPWHASMFQVSEREHILVAEQDQRIVGYLCYYQVLDEAHILNIAVDPAYRRRGIGKRLVATVVTLPGVRDVYLEVRPSNTGAVQLYRKMGFVVIGRRPRYYRDREDALVMCRRCSEGPGSGADPRS